MAMKQPITVVIRFDEMYGLLTPKQIVNSIAYPFKQTMKRKA